MNKFVKVASHEGYGCDSAFGDAGSNSEMVDILVTMSRAMYAQLHQQMFAPPRKYPMPAVADPKHKQAELGMKLTCGFEMMYWERQRFEGNDVDMRAGASQSPFYRYFLWPLELLSKLTCR